MSETAFRIAVVIPTKNRPNDLLRCIQSVITQLRQPDELIIVDQSADPGIRIKVERLCESGQLQCKLKYIYDTTITGLVEAKARGVAEASADIIIFLEDDVVLQPDYIHEMELGFRRYPHMAGCCGVVKAAPKQGSFHRLIFRLFHRGIFADPRVGIHGQPYMFDGRMIPSPYLSGGLSAYRKEVFNKVLFDTKNGFFMLEDVDFSTRASRIYGADAFYINTAAILEHMMSPVNRAVLGKKFENKFREYTLFYKNNSDRPRALLNFIWLLTGLMCELVFETIRSLDVGIFYGGVRGLVKGICWRIRPLQEYT